ncbi:MAG: transcriptional regulator [Gammaproteobacteria bacterium]|nr:transcriptional regulator [Gammaproteobacteria bacterium]
MPVISRFYGILITMYFKDHNPPHFHASYAGYKAMISLDGQVLEGTLPVRARKLTLDWVAQHEQQLQENWRRAQSGVPLDPIAPLE